MKKEDDAIDYGTKGYATYLGSKNPPPNSFQAKLATECFQYEEKEQLSKIDYLQRQTPIK